MSQQEPQPPQRCGTCGGLGAVVERYPVKDEDGYEYMAHRDAACPTCQGKKFL